MDTYQHHRNPLSTAIIDLAAAWERAPNIDAGRVTMQLLEGLQELSCRSEELHEALYPLVVAAYRAVGKHN